jgi:hypothetical protein
VTQQETNKHDENEGGRKHGKVQESKREKKRRRARLIRHDIGIQSW